MNFNNKIGMDEIAGKEIFLPLYIRNPKTGQLENICLPINYSDLERLISGLKRPTIPNLSNEFSPSTGNVKSFDRFPSGEIVTNGKTVTIYRNQPNSRQGNDHHSNGKDISARTPITRKKRSIDRGLKNKKGNLIKPIIPPESSINPENHCFQPGDNSLNPRDQLLELFLKKCCHKSYSALTSRKELQDTYDRWSELGGKPPIGGNVMADYLNRFYQTQKVRGKTHYVGLTIKPEWSSGNNDSY